MATPTAIVSVLLLTYLAPRDVAVRQANAQFVVVPSIWDVFNYTAAEAMANAAVVICSDGAGAADLIEHGTNGFMVPADDPNALAGAIEQAVALPFRSRQEIGDRARKTIVETLNPSRIARQRVETYGDIDRGRAKSTTGNDWLADALKREGAGTTVAASKPMAFLDQHPLRDILSYVRHKIIDRVYDIW